jgi:hypothetical protein
MGGKVKSLQIFIWLFSIFCLLEDAGTHHSSVMGTHQSSAIP